jgi:hypothetical protein
MKIRSLLLLAMLALLGVTGIISCKDFEPDPFMPGLPRYSEEGLFTAGAIYDNKVWVHGAWASWYQGSSTLSANFNDGRLDIRMSLFTPTKNNEPSESMEIEFFLTGIAIRTEEAFKELAGTTYTFGGNSPHWAMVSNEFDNYYSFNGQIFIRNASIDENGNTILSGTFGIEVENDISDILKITYGRFDLYTNLSF